MTWVIMVCASIAAAFLQTMFPAPALLGQIKWPLLLALTIYYALQHETQVLLVAALLAGFLQDALSPVPLGYSAVVFLLIGWGGARFRALVMSDAAVTQACFGLVGGAVSGLALYFLLRSTGALALAAGPALHKIAGLAVEGLLCTPLVFMGLGGLDRMVGNTLATKEVEGSDSELDGITE